MTPQTAVHGSNGPTAGLAPPERDALLEKVRAAVEGPANETPQQLIARVARIPRSSLELMADDMPWIGVKCRDSAWSSMNGGTEAMRNIIMAKLAEALVTEPVPDAESAAPANDEEATEPAKPKRARTKKTKARAKPRSSVRTDLAPLPTRYQQVIQALKQQRVEADESTQNLLDDMVQAAERHDRVALEDILTQAKINNANMKMFGLIWAALEDRDTRWAMLIEEAARGFHPRDSFLEGRSLFRGSVAQIRERLPSADPDMAIAPERDANSQPGS